MALKKRCKYCTISSIWDFQIKIQCSGVFKKTKTKTKYHLFFTCHKIRDCEQFNLILPCFDRSSSNFPIAKGKGRKIRKGRGVNPGQGLSPDQEAGRELGPDQDHQIATEKGI